MTRECQVKHGHGRHEKGDRRAIGDRSNYVLGWSNEQKIDALIGRASTLQRRQTVLADDMESLKEQHDTLIVSGQKLAQLKVFGRWDDIDWRAVAAEITTLDDEKRRIEQQSGELSDVTARIEQHERALQDADERRRTLDGDIAVARERLRLERKDVTEAEALLADADLDDLADVFVELSAHVPDDMGGSWDRRHAQLSERLSKAEQARLNEQNRAAARIVGRMDEFRQHKSSKPASWTRRSTRSAAFVS